MRENTPLHVIWRRRWIVLACFLVFAAGTAVVSKLLPKTYVAHSTLLIAQRAEAQTFDSVQASQTVARSYADILDSPNIAQQVEALLGAGAPSYRSILGSASFQPIPDTQLLEIDVERRSAHQAQAIANAYATAFIAYAQQHLADTTKANVTVADAAALPRSPARPKPTLYTVIAAILGLALGLALAFVRERFDRRLRTPEDVESQFETPVLARVPVRGRSHAAVVAFDESFRVLRTNLQFAGVEGDLSSLAVVSGKEGEGKTTTVAALARASSEIGLRVIAVEGDLRRPALYKMLRGEGAGGEWRGLSSYLIGAAELEEVIHPTTSENLWVIPCGPLPPSPWALLESPRARSLMQDLRPHADIVVVDAPPMGVGADAAVIADWVDGVIVVVDLSKATDRSVRDSLRQLQTAKSRILGLVLNKDRTARSSSYEYYMTAAADGKGTGRRKVRGDERRAGSFTG